MQEAAFRAVGLKAFYLPFEMKRKDFLRLMRRRKNLLLDGFNVTVPYKEEVCRYLDKLSPAACAIGAVNTVVRQGARWVGFNTDYVGFIRSLEKTGFRPRGKKILILGAGGSARAVAYGLAKGRAREIILANRTPRRAGKIISDFRRLFPRIEWGHVELKKTACHGGAVPFLQTRTREIDWVVNATSVGLRPNDPALVSPKDFLNQKTLFVDLIYNPAETRFLRLARQAGHPTLNGMGMLLYQGTEAFHLWTGRKAPVEVMRKVLLSVSASFRNTASQ